jgi:small subunit ribosomal protein S20
VEKKGKKTREGPLSSSHRRVLKLILLFRMMVQSQSEKEEGMAQHKSAIKRARVSKRRADRNKQWRTRMRSAIKRVRSSKEKTAGLAELRKTTKLLDQLASKGIIHRNKASNDKSRLTKFVNHLP